MTSDAPKPRGKVVLVLEDDPPIQRMIERVLISQGFSVELASDGLEGLVKLERCKPDLIITDIMMPRLDGLTFARAIKSREQTRTIPLIFLTAKGDSRTLIEGINVGARFFLTKPFSVEELMAKVKKVLGS